MISESHLLRNGLRETFHLLFVFISFNKHRLIRFQSSPGKVHIGHNQDIKKE